MVILDTLTIIICLVFCAKSVKQIKYGSLNVYDLLQFVFFCVNVFPLLTDYLFQDQLKGLLDKIYIAMTDVTVSVVYDIIVICISYVLYTLSNRYRIADESYLKSVETIKLNKILRSVTIIVALLPLISIMFSPDISVYFKFAYFYTNEGNSLTINRIYHEAVVNLFINYSMVVILLYYFSQNRKQWIVYMLTFINLWISQKRAFIFFVFGGIIFYDLLSQKHANDIKGFFKKTVFLLLTATSYFIVYSNNTIKQVDEDPYTTYVMYATRHYCMKTAIYDALNENKILDSTGQTMWFDLFFFIPRTYWTEKPVMYQRYFTNYVFGRDMSNQVDWVNFLVNIWTEYISNFGAILGPIIALILIWLITRLSANNRITYLTGSAFLGMYFVFGFEPVVMLFYLIWVFALLKYHKRENPTLYIKH